MVGYFGSVVDAGRAVEAIGASGVVPSALELIDRHCLEAVDAWKNMGLSVDADVVLLGRSDVAGAAGDAEAATMVSCFEEAGATFAAASTDAEEAEALFDARRLAYPALERLGPLLTEDVCVPKAAVPEMLARVEAISRRHDVLIANIAHAGDGNLHPLLSTPLGDEAAKARAQLAFVDIVEEALALGGTVSGEHGVGLLKRDGLAREQSSEVVAMQRAVKAGAGPARHPQPRQGPLAAEPDMSLPQARSRAALALASVLLPALGLAACSGGSEPGAPSGSTAAGRTSALASGAAASCRPPAGAPSG